MGDYVSPKHIAPLPCDFKIMEKPLVEIILREGITNFFLPLGFRKYGVQQLGVFVNHCFTMNKYEVIKNVV